MHVSPSARAWHLESTQQLSLIIAIIGSILSQVKHYFLPGFCCYPLFNLGVSLPRGTFVQFCLILQGSSRTHFPLLIFPRQRGSLLAPKTLNTLDNTVTVRPGHLVLVCFSSSSCSCMLFALQDLDSLRVGL